MGAEPGHLATDVTGEGTSGRTVVVARPAAARLLAIARFLAEGEGRERLLLASTTRAGRELLRDAAAKSGATFGVHCYTLAQLAADLAGPALASRGAAPLASLAAEAVAARALARCSERAPLAFFGGVCGSPGFLRALVSTLAELRLHHVDPGSLSGLGDRGADLARLLAAYAEELDRWRLVDAAGTFELATAAVKGGFHRFRGLPLALLDVPLRTPVEAALVAALAASAPRVLATSPSGDDESCNRLAAALGTAAEVLNDEGAAAGAMSGAEPRRLRRSRRLLFAPDPAEAPTPDGAGDDSLVVFSAPGEGAEAVEVARRLLRLAEAGVPFDHVAVLLRDPDSYQPLVEEAFARAGIPAWFSRGVLRPDPGGRAFLALLDCAADDLSARRFAEYLSLGQVPRTDSAGAPPVRPVPWVEMDPDERPGARGELAELEGAPFEQGTPEGAAESAVDEADAEAPVLAGTLRAPLQWERLLVEAAVVGGRDRWARRLRGLERELALQREGAEDEATAERLTRQVERVRTLERFALPLVDALAALPRAASWGEWLPQLEALAARALAAPERVLRVLAELRPMAEVGPLGLAEVRQVLARRLSFLRETPRDRPYGRVFVGAVDEARARSFHTVFLPGLGEGVFPRKPQEDPLLLDNDRGALAGGLPQQETRVARERLLLRLAAGAAEAALVLSWSTLDTLQGRPRVPSFYALDVVRAAEGALPRQRELARRAAEGCALLPGWPAPESPADALDAAEHDLAVLRPLLALPPEATRGRGRFLLSVNAHLARALRSRYARWRRGFGPADGLVDPGPDARAHLAAFRLAARPWAVTTLQGWAACPYRFLLKGVHRLRPRDEVIPLEHLDPATRGQLFHRVQAEALRELAGRDLLPFRREHRELLLDCVERQLQQVAAEAAEELAPALPRVWDSEVDELRTDLRGWVQAVLDEEEAWIPARFELAFGLDEHGRDTAPRDPGSSPTPVLLDIAGGLRLRGAIDLVEQLAPGQKGTVAAELRVTDHKTGRALDTRRLSVGGGETLQPLLYALAAEALLGVPARGGRLFFCTRKGGYQSLEARLDPFKRRDLEETLLAIDGAVAGAFLPAAPRSGACTWCDYKLACGSDEELRLRRKRADDRLAPLRDVRGKE
jgi:ATP-dependent helicase/nuclease subunit B